MSNQRTTYGKILREREKQAKAQAKQEKRAARAASTPEPETRGPVADQTALLEAFARLHDDLEEGRITFEQFEEKRDQLRVQLSVD